MGATAAKITYYYADGTTSGPLTTTTLVTLAPSPRPAYDSSNPVLANRATGFSVTFSSTVGIPPSATATVPVMVQANPAQTAPDLAVVFSNTFGVTGKDVHGLTPDGVTATDKVTVYAEQITLSTKKSFDRSTILSSPGQTLSARLATTIADYPQSTRTVDRLEIADPTPGTSTDFYKYFDAAQITLTQIPTNAKLSVEYLSCTTDSWTSLGAGFEDVVYGSTDAPAGMFTKTIPAGLREDICGIKFIYEPIDAASGFVPGQTLSPNITHSLRSTLRGSSPVKPVPNQDLVGVLTNCSTAQAHSGAMASNVAKSDCVPVDLQYANPGTDMIDKKFVNTNNTSDQNQITTRNSTRTRVQLGWSTAGYSNVGTMVVSDTRVDAAGNPVAPLASSAFDAFDLVSVPAIGSAQDPYLQYDRVYLQLWNGTAWVMPSGGTWGGTACTVATPCAGQFPGYTLSTAERNSTSAVRLVYSERSGRTTVSPAPGTGVAASTGNSRGIYLLLQMRDTRRSNPALPVLAGTTYNSASTGVVNNDTSAQAFSGAALVRSTTDADVISLFDPDLGITVAKTWDGGSVALPNAGVPSSAWPTTRVTVKATNTTTARVNSLSVVDPDVHPSNLQQGTPFDEFNLKSIVGITTPSGATGVSIAFAGAPELDVSGSAAATIATAMAYSEAAMVNVTGITVTLTGAIAASANTVITYDLRIRDTMRGTSTPVSTGTLRNQARGEVRDPRYNADGTTLSDSTLNAPAAASIAIVAGTFAVAVGKVLNPSSQNETQNPTPNITATLSGTPGGSQRATSLTLTDDAATFWNSFNFVGVSSSFALPTFSPNASTGTLRVYPEVCISRGWSAAETTSTQTCADGGGQWVSKVSDPSAVANWLTPAQVIAGILPAGVTAGDVVGVRFTIKRLDGSNWENPYAPTISVPLTVVRRATMRTGGAVPSDLQDGGSAAPGESVKGRTTNTLKVNSVSSTGNTAQASTTATYTFAHATSSVRVEKLPAAGSTVPAGRVIPYQLVVTNNGQWPIVNPVITDSLPSDANGPQLQVDSADDDGVPDFSYVLTGGVTTPSGPALPTDPTQVTAAITPSGAGISKIQFSFAAGTVLEPGQSYTISVPLIFRPGLVETDAVRNVFGVTGDRQLDGCSAPSPKPYAFDAATNTCSTETTIKPAASEEITSVKAVRPITDETSYPDDLGFTTGSGTDCVAARDSEGFSVRPCTPRTMPGQTEEWRISIQNTGTRPISRLVVTDRLPTPGDTTLGANLARGSQWTAGFTGKVPVLSGPTGGTLTTYFTTAAEPCLNVLNQPSTGTCTADPAAGWAVWDSAAGVDPATVTALQFVVDYAPAAQYFAPGATMNIKFQTTTAAYSTAAVTDPVAANSVSISAVARSGSATSYIAARGYPVARVALVTGTMKLRKAVTGPAAGFVPSDQQFNGELVCTSAGTVIPTLPFTLTAGQSISFANLPGGASCTATETAASGQTSYTAPAQVVVPSATTDLPEVVLTNRYELTSLDIVKQVHSDAETVPTGFDFTASCTFLGADVPLAAADATFKLDADGKKTITGLPAGATCTVTEVDSHGADSTVTSGLSADGSVVTDQATRTATITGISAVGSEGEPDSATFENYYGIAGLRVSKVLDGSAATQMSADKSFPVTVVCTFDNETTTYTASLNAGNGWAASWPNVIQDSTCVITETDARGATAVRITPNDSVTLNRGVVTIPTADVVEAQVTNWYPGGSLAVTKTFTGDGVDKFATGDFVVELTCTLDGAPIDVVDGSRRTLTKALPDTVFEHLPNGAECTLAEIQTAGATSSRIIDAASDATLAEGTAGYTFTVDASDLSALDQPQPALNVENTFLLTSVSVSKKVVSKATDAAGTPLAYGPFEVMLSCTFEGAPVPLVEDATQTVAAGEAVTWTGLPVGAQCHVTETKTAGAVLTEVILASAPNEPIAATEADLPVLVEAPTDNAVTLANHFGTAAVTISKSILGTGADKVRAQTYTVHLECVLVDDSRPAPGATVWSKDYTIGGKRGLTAQVTTLAAGAQCLVTETKAGGATKTHITARGHRTAGTSASFTAIATDNPISVVVENTFVAKPAGGSGGEGNGNPPKNGGHLAQTGATIAGLLAAIVLLFGGGWLLVGRSRRRPRRH